MKRVLVFAVVLGLAFAAGASVAQTGGDRFTGCLTPGGDLKGVAVGLDPLSECRGQSTEVSWSSASGTEDLKARVAQLEMLLAGVTRTGDTLVFDGMNLQVVNGTGSTDGPPNGLGNLTIGYNTGAGLRTGSHYLIVGDDHQYSSFGGIVSGFSNTATGEWSTVLGGRFSLSEGDFAVVLGGQSHGARGQWSVVVGGSNNDTNHDFATITGGSDHNAAGVNSTISGGNNNETTETYATISGGQNNSADGFGSSVSGGQNNSANGDFSSILGGNGITLTGTYATSP